MEKDGSLAKVSLNLVESVKQEVRRASGVGGIQSTLTQPLPAAMSWPTRWWWGYWGLMVSTPELVWNLPAANSTSSVLTTTVCLSLPWTPLTLPHGCFSLLTHSCFFSLWNTREYDKTTVHINVTFGNINFLVTYANNASGCTPAYLDSCFKLQTK